MKAFIQIGMAVVLCACAAPPQALKAGAAASRGEIQNPSFLRIVYFETASTTPLPSQNRHVLDEAGTWAKETGRPLLVEGHCDERGSELYNLELGDRRAREVTAWIIGQGVDAKRLVVASKGESEPVDRGHRETAWRQNRRVVLKSLP